MNALKWILIITIGLLSEIGFSQNNFNQPVPVDPSARIGRLGNGMTYYIRHNEEPKERASFYIIRNAGALLENDDQNGLAHFLEHMAFNGTLHFPGKEMISTFQKHGVEHGRNINAYTDYGETVYNLSDIPVKHEGLLDTCLLVLNDWSHYLLLKEEEIDAERGVITEEWRQRQNASRRMSREFSKVLFKGSKFANRDVIGDMNVVRDFKYETLRNFYYGWYRTDLQAIAIVGDIDVDAVEKKVIALFSKIEPVKNPLKREFFEIPGHTETRYFLATDKEATDYSVTLYIKHKSPDRSQKDQNYLRGKIIQSLFVSMVRDRINEMLQQGVSPFISGSINYGRMVVGYDAFTISTTAKPNQYEIAFRAIYTEAQRLYQHGFTPGEFNRARINFLTSRENQYKQRDKIWNDQYAMNFKSYYVEGEPLTSVDFDWTFVQQVLPTITVEEVSDRIRQWMTPENRVIEVIGPDKPEAIYLSEPEILAMMSEIEKTNLEPYVDQVVSSTLIKEELKGSQVKSTKKLPEFDAVEWTLGNDAKVVFRRADYEKEQVSLTAFSQGGSSKLALNQLASAMVLNQFAGSFGVGEYNATALKKALTGKNASMSANLSELNETFSGSASPKDFETMMQLLYLKFEKPRFDTETYEAMLGRSRAVAANMVSNPQKIQNDSLALIMTCNSQRTKLMTPALFDEISMKQMQEIYHERFADAGDFIFLIVGNIEEATAKSMAEKYIGSLANLPRKESWTDCKVRGPEGKTVREIVIPQDGKKATVIVNYAIKMEFTPEKNILLNVLRDVLAFRCTEEIREKEGGSYGVRVSANSLKFPVQEKSLRIMFDTEQGKAQHLQSIVHTELEKIATNGPTAEDLDKSIKSMQKNRELSKPHNGYWMQALNTYYTYGYNPASNENYENIVAKLNAQQVQNLARTILSKGDVVDLIFKSNAD